MQIALLSDANSPGPFRHQPLAWQINGVEALAWALGGHVWHGTEPDEAFLNSLDAYDLLVSNFGVMFFGFGMATVFLLYGKKGETHV